MAWPSGPPPTREGLGELWGGGAKSCMWGRSQELCVGEGARRAVCVGGAKSCVWGELRAVCGAELG